MDNDYNSFTKTAIHRNSLSKPAEYLWHSRLLIGSILDYGCGYGYDVIELTEMGCNGRGYDKYNEAFLNEEVLSCMYDTVMCNYVLNVIPSKEKVREIIVLLRSIGKNIYISVRSDSNSIQEYWDYDEDNEGYWTMSGSFQRFYTNNMIEECCGNVEILRTTSTYKLFKLI